MWGYNRSPGAQHPEQERPTLNAWASMQDTVPWLRFADDLGTIGADPGEAYEGDRHADAVRATELGLRNLRAVARLLEPGREGGRGADVPGPQGALRRAPSPRG
jgi:hypothetical protein